MTDRPVSEESRTEALAFLIQYHRRQAEQIHKEREGGLHSGESWVDCPSLICRNTQWDIDKALAIEAEARATSPALDDVRRAIRYVTDNGPYDLSLVRECADWRTMSPPDSRSRTMTDRSHRRYGESGRGDDPAKGANATPAQAVTSLSGPNPTTPQPSTPSPHPRRRLNRLHALRSKWGDCYWKPGDGASAPEWADDPCEELEPDLIEFENDVRADFAALLRRADSPSPEGAEPRTERLAALEHEQWAQWASTLLATEPGISEARRERWQRLIATSYADLTEAEKHEDRIWAEKVEREAALPEPSLDFDSASALLSAYNYWLNDNPEASVGDRYDWTKRYLARLRGTGGATADG